MALVAAPTVKGVTPVRSVLLTHIQVIQCVNPVPVKLRRVRGLLNVSCPTVQWGLTLPILRTPPARLVRQAILPLVVRSLLVAWIVRWGITTMQVMMHATRARRVKPLRGGLRPAVRVLRGIIGWNKR